MNKHSLFDRDIARRCGLTPAGLKALAKAASDPHGWVTGPGKGNVAVNTRQRLAREGLIELVEYAVAMPERHRITDLGRQRVKFARSLGW